METPKIIAIDGPAASGKSTLGENLAEVLAYLYFDTGLMYRAVAWAVLENGTHLDDETAITALAERIQIDVRPPTVADGRRSDVVVDGQDVTWEIHKSGVDSIVSVIAAYPGVRTALTTKQRKIGLRGRVVMVGRDIGTVVLPEADLKIFLDASVEERARRRFAESVARGEEVDFEEVLASMRRRDRIDSSRKIAPLRPAEDAIRLNSDGYSAEQVLAQALQLWRAEENQELDGTHHTTSP